MYIHKWPTDGCLYVTCFVYSGFEINESSLLSSIGRVVDKKAES